MPLLDRFARPLRSLRVSVTDRCNLRCQYCMPEQDYVWLPRESLLTFEEIGVVVDAFTPLGVDRVRITGGEPLLRRDLPVLLESLAGRGTIADLALTTNGVLLARQARALRSAGLHRITVSLDTLRRDRFQALTRMDELAEVLAGIDTAAAAGFSALKLDTVVIRGVNDDELVAMLEYGQRMGAEVRFIEYMTSEGRRGGRARLSYPAGRSCRGSRRITAPSCRSRSGRQLPPPGFCCPGARPSESSRPRQNPSVLRATAAVSPLTASGSSVCTRPPEQTCAGRSAPARHPPTSSASSRRSGP